ncbi:hypothetical protein BD413DRAFT_31273 [Trametes elegans]|nr:hypothetical protein BD413DRAFT_31273 [Trametes elegans]
MQPEILETPAVQELAVEYRCSFLSHTCQQLQVPRGMRHSPGCSMTFRGEEDCQYCFSPEPGGCSYKVRATHVTLTSPTTHISTGMGIHSTSPRLAQRFPTALPTVVGPYGDPRGARQLRGPPQHVPVCLLGQLALQKPGIGGRADAPMASPPRPA